MSAEGLGVPPEEIENTLIENVSVADSADPEKTFVEDVSYADAEAGQTSIEDSAAEGSTPSEVTKTNPMVSMTDRYKSIIESGVTPRETRSEIEQTAARNRLRVLIPMTIHRITGKDIQDLEEDKGIHFLYESTSQEGIYYDMVMTKKQKKEGPFGNDYTFVGKELTVSEEGKITKEELLWEKGFDEDGKGLADPDLMPLSVQDMRDVASILASEEVAHAIMSQDAAFKGETFKLQDMPWGLPPEDYETLFPD